MLYEVITGCELQELSAITEHCAAYLGVFILQCEVNMARGWLCQVGDLGLYPDRWEAALEHGTHLAIQAGYIVDVRIGRCIARSALHQVNISGRNNFV